MPRGITAISPGATWRGPSSVRSRTGPRSGTNSSSPSASTKYLSVIDRFAAYRCTAMPFLVLMSPFPATVYSPSTKSVAASGMGSAFQRSRFGSGSISSNGVPRSVPLPIRENLGCAAEGMIRYTQVRRATARGWVNAVPLICSAYKPNGARCGELRPWGTAPGTASLTNSFPNPRW
jgi:hypothetical protein